MYSPRHLVVNDVGFFFIYCNERPFSEIRPQFEKKLKGQLVATDMLPGRSSAGTFSRATPGCFSCVRA